MGLSPPKMWHPPTCLQKCMVLPQCFKLQEPQRLLNIPFLTLPALIRREIFARTPSQILFEIVHQSKFSKTPKFYQKLLAHFLFIPPMGKFTKRPGRWARQIFHLWKLMVSPLPPLFNSILRPDPTRSLQPSRCTCTEKRLAPLKWPRRPPFLVSLRPMVPDVFHFLESKCQIPG